MEAGQPASATQRDRPALTDLLRALRSRVARRILVWMLVLGGLGTLLLSGWEARNEYLAHLDHDGDTLQTLATWTAPGLSRSLWAFDEAQVALTLKSFTTFRDVTTVELEVPRRAPRVLGALLPDDRQLSRTVDLVHDDDGQHHLMGRLTLVKDRQIVRDASLRRLGRALLVNGLTTLLAALVSVLIYHAIVTRRLIRLAQHLRGVTPAELLREPLPVPAPPLARDEVDDLMRSVAALQATAHNALTEKAAQHERLRTSESLFHGIVSQASDGIVVADAHTLTIIEANPSACAQSGYSREEMLALGLHELVLDYSEQQVRSNVLSVDAETGRTLVTRHRRRDGGHTDVHVAYRRVRLNGRDCVIGVYRDIGAEKAARDAIDSAAEWHRALIHNTVEGVAIFDDQRRVIEVNQRFAQMLGRQPQDLVGLHPSAWDLDVDAGRMESDLRLTSDMSVTFETRHRRADGSAYDAEVSMQAARVGGRQVYVSLTRDISARREAERALLQLNAELERRVSERTADLAQAHARLSSTQFAMDSVGIGIWWVEPESGRIVWANRAAADLLGYTVDQLLQFAVSDLDPSFAPDQVQAVMADLRRRGQLRLETTQRHRLGPLVPVEVNIHFQEAAEGSPALSIAFVTDIRERKAAERTLHDAKEAAEAANRAKSAFLANMSHEIRTPLNAITGMAHLVRRSGVSPQQGERLDKLQAASDHLLSVIDAILELSKIEAGKVVLAHEPLQVQSVLDEVWAMLHDRALVKGLQFHRQLKGMPPVLLGDATRLQQALLNYAANAIKFTDRGQVVMVAAIERDDGDSVLLRFEVEDSGVGIEPEALARLFNTFEQADNSASRRHGGTGLGLAITRKLAQLMGGEAGARSEPGRGSCFWFTARLHKAAAASLPDTPWSEPDAERRLRALAGDRRVLLAEDDPINREVATELLATVGLRVDSAHDGHQAVALAAARPYDLVLMDMQMPGLDGLAATRRIRQLPGWADRPIVAMTANAFEDDRRACRDAGMDDFITKPVDTGSLYAVVARWLERSTGEA